MSISLFVIMTVSLYAGTGDDHKHPEADKNSEALFTEALDKNKLLSHDLVLAFERKCQSCHDGYAKNTLAPPIFAVQQVYLRLAQQDIEKAKKRMIYFLKNPKLEYTLMKPAVKLYSVMPNLNLSDKEASDFTKVILETKFSLPKWFNEHYKGHKLKSLNNI